MVGQVGRSDDGGLRQPVAGSPIKRIGRGRFLRNVLIAIGNSADRALIPAVLALLGDGDRLVRGAAVWALARLSSVEQISALAAARLPKEDSSDVRGEWRLSLG